MLDLHGISDRTWMKKIKQFCLNKVYKTDLLKENKIEFPVGQSVGEDFLFNVEYLQYCKKVVYKSDCLYHYYQRQTSVMRTYNKKYTDHILNYEANLKELLQNQIIQYRKMTFCIYI